MNIKETETAKMNAVSAPTEYAKSSAHTESSAPTISNCPSETILCKHWFVSGEVQGVGFRHRAMRAASALGIAGWVKNLWDGRVEIMAQGPVHSLAKMLPSIEENSDIEIREVQEETLEPIQNAYGFKIR